MAYIQKRKDKDGTTQLLWWKSQIGHCLLSDLTPALIAEQRDSLLKGTTFKKTTRSSTVVRYLAALSHVLKVATKEWGWINDSPMRKVTKPKEPRVRIRFLDENERKALLIVCQESSNTFLYPAFVLSISTGMRQGELMGLRFELSAMLALAVVATASQKNIRFKLKKVITNRGTFGL